MQRPTNAWSRFSNSGTNRFAQAPAAPVQPSYDHDDADTVGWSSQQSSVYNGWMLAEACKVKDALFIGNLMAVQVSLSVKAPFPRPPCAPVVHSRPIQYHVFCLDDTFIGYSRALTSYALS
jgi:hypothetical protein